MGAFSGEARCTGTLTFATPAGPFRVAIYGTEVQPDGKARDFVVRSVLLTGVEAAKPRRRRRQRTRSSPGW